MPVHLTPSERAARNVIAFLFGLDQARTEAAMLDPAFSSRAQELAVGVLDGPWGFFAPTDAQDLQTAGYVKALQDTIEHLDRAQIVVPNEYAAEIVSQLVSRLRADVQAQIDAVTAPPQEEEKASGTDALSQLLSGLFGWPVTVVQVEQAQG